MSTLAPAWRRWLLLIALFVVGTGYVAAFAFFLLRSEDFIARALNAPARAYALAHPLTTDTVMRFAADSPDLRRLGSGWHPPDADGPWSNWPDAWLFVAIAAPDGDASIAIEAEGFSAAGLPRKTVTLSIDGTELGQWILDEQSPRLSASVTIPVEFVHSGLLALHFNVDTPTSPWHRRVGDDTRSLGLQLLSVRIER